jgi:hypothetical protein
VRHSVSGDSLRRDPAIDFVRDAGILMIDIDPVVDWIDAKPWRSGKSTMAVARAPAAAAFSMRNVA